MQYAATMRSMQRDHVRGMWDSDWLPNISGKQAIYTNWLPTQPDNWQGNEDCATLKDLASRQWNDSPCSDTIYYALCVRGLCDVGHQLEQQKSYV